MIESEGSILSYRPDLETLGKTFQFRHVESLLIQADELMEKCLSDLKNYSSLSYAWTQFITDLETEEKQLELDKKLEEQGEEAAAEPAAEPPAEAEEEVGEEETPPEEPGAGEEEEKHEEGAEAPAETFESYGEIPEETTALQIKMKALRRRRVLSGVGGPFALNEQRDLALTRLGGNYREAVNRAAVAEEGLKRIYDRSEPSLPIATGSETLSAMITSVAMWVRDSIKWLEAYQQQEQNFTRVLSIRSLLNRSQWTQLKHSRDSYSLKLRIPDELFRSHDNCRIRAVGASLVGEAGVVPWSMSIRVPERAVYERNGGAVEVDQSNLPPCLLGRVENRRGACPSQSCDTTVLNASPMGLATPEGAWTIEIFKPLGSSVESFDHISDIVLEINAVGIPRQPRG